MFFKFDRILENVYLKFYSMSKRFPFVFRLYSRKLENPVSFAILK
jgi:hypothetical protein